MGLLAAAAIWGGGGGICSRCIPQTHAPTGITDCTCCSHGLVQGVPSHPSCPWGTHGASYLRALRPYAH